MAWPPLWSPSVQAMLSAVLRAGPEPTAGLSHLSTPDSILMSSRYNLSDSALGHSYLHMGVAKARVCNGRRGHEGGAGAKGGVRAGGGVGGVGSGGGWGVGGGGG